MSESEAKSCTSRTLGAGWRYVRSCWALIPVGVMLPDVCPQCGASGAHLYVLPDGLRDDLQRQPLCGALA